MTLIHLEDFVKFFCLLGKSSSVSLCTGSFINWVISILLGCKRIPSLLSLICLLSVKSNGEVEFGTLYKIGWNDKIYLQGES